MALARQYSNDLLDMNDQDMFDKDLLIEMLVYWMSEEDVKAFMHANKFTYEQMEENANC